MLPKRTRKDKKSHNGQEKITYQKNKAWEEQNGTEKTEVIKYRGIVEGKRTKTNLKIMKN